MRNSKKLKKKKNQNISKFVVLNFSLFRNHDTRRSIKILFLVMYHD